MQGAGLYVMEIVAVFHSHVGVVKSATHHVLGVLLGPGVTMEARRNSGVLSLVAIAGRLELIAAFHLNALQETFKHSLGVVLDLSREVLVNNLVDELNDCGGKALPCRLIVQIWLQIALLDGTGSVTGHIAHMAGALEGVDGEHVLLSGLDVDLRVPVGFSQTRNTQETVLGATKSKSRHIVVKVSRTVIVDRVVTTEEHGAHKDLTFDDVGVLVGVLLRYDATERVTSEKDVITSEASLCELLESLLHVMIHQHRLWKFF